MRDGGQFVFIIRSSVSAVFESGETTDFGYVTENVRSPTNEDETESAVEYSAFSG